MLRNEKGRDLVAALPADRLLTETDAPITKFNNRPTSPIDVKATIDTLAAFRGKTSEDLTQAINSNLRTLLNAAGVSNENGRHHFIS
jgi:TatD DNase family protein